MDPHDGCHGSPKVLNGSSGMITSPGYDGSTPYDDNLDCSWLIEAPAGMAITVKIHVRSNSKYLCYQ